MDPGKLDRTIVIQRRTATPNDYNEEIYSWATLVTIKAAVLPALGWERFRSGREMSADTARFIVRYYSGITVKDRISYNSKTWDITGIAEMGRRRFLELTAEVVK